jgi:hypothetical protein
MSSPVQVYMAGIFALCSKAGLNNRKDTTAPSSDSTVASRFFEDVAESELQPEAMTNTTINPRTTRNFAFKILLFHHNHPE